MVDVIFLMLLAVLILAAFLPVIGIVTAIVLFCRKQGRQRVAAFLLMASILSAGFAGAIFCSDISDWNYIVPVCAVTCMLVTGLIAGIVLSIRSAKNKCASGTAILLLTVQTVLAAGFGLFIGTHPTHYKYSDRQIIGSDIHAVAERYGAFDSKGIKEGQEGEAGYYLYTENSGFLPDHLPHYYYMKYDAQGIVYAVYDGAAPGG